LHLWLRPHSGDSKGSQNIAKFGDTRLGGPNGLSSRQAAKATPTQANRKNLPENPRAALRDAGKKQQMEYSELENNDSIYQSNARAEDGMQPRSRWNALCEGVIIPIGSLFTVFLAMLGIMLLTR
jgi:hypothetical protein